MFMYFQYHLSYYTRLSIHIQAENKLINKKIYVYKSKIYGKIYNEEYKYINKKVRKI